MRSPFRAIEPTIYSGLLDDPVVWVRVRPLGRSLLFDCGQITHLAKRVLKSVEALFITHAHMDHFMGIDTFVRHVHVAPRTFDLFGPPGLARRMECKLQGYDWNLTEPHWCDLRVSEIHPGLERHFLLRGAEGFPLRLLGESARTSRTIYRNRYLQVEAETGDHALPVLFFRLTEAPPFAVDEEKIAAEGLVPGGWVGRLKKSFYLGELGQEPLEVRRRWGEGAAPQVVADTRALYERIRREEAPASLGYLTDIGFTAQNREKAVSLLAGVSVLVAECTFLAADKEKARASRHLCTDDLNALVRELRPRYLVPVHLSKAYVHRSARLYEELRAPQGTTVLALPDRIPSRPLMAHEVPEPIPVEPSPQST